MFLGFIASALAKEDKLIDQIVRDLMDENVTTIVLTGKAGVGKTLRASKISERAKQVGIGEIRKAMQVGAGEISSAKQVDTCFGTIWVFPNDLSFPNPGDLSFPNPGDHRPHCVSIAHQLSILSTAEEWEDHSTVIDDEKITVNDEKKATDDGTGKSGDDTAFKDDEKEATEWSLMERISEKLTKMRSDELEKLRIDMLQKLRFDMLQQVKMRFDMLEEVRIDMTAVLEKMRSDDELEKVGVEREKFPTYHKLTHHTIKFTKYSQLQSTTYCC